MEYVKIETFLPVADEVRIIEGLNDAGLLSDGNYDFAYASTPVVGHWRPLEDAHPYKGKTGEVSSEPEVKLEFRVRATDIDEVIELIHALHPYEKPVINAIALL